MSQRSNMTSSLIRDHNTTLTMASGNGVNDPPSGDALPLFDAVSSRILLIKNWIYTLRSYSP
jgi:hypothetical protein